MQTATTDTFDAFIWDDKFNTGVDEVDVQHQKLVEMINKLGSISMHLTNTEELGAVLTELANYTVYHFNTEEDLMKKYDVDAGHQKVHIRSHQHFTEQVTVAAKILMGNSDASRKILMDSADVSSHLVATLLKYLTNWLVQHILGLDARMGKEILALQAGDSHEEAVRKANDFMSQSANVLMEALNEMYGKLGDKTLEVMQKNQELEQRVKERTSDLEQANQHLQANNVQLKQLNEKLESAHTQLLQSEKMASIGQLAAGVAHEINNPVGFVNSNLGTLGKYITSIFDVVSAYEAAEAKNDTNSNLEIAQVKKKVDYPYLVEDIPSLLKESQDGLSRVKRIVQDLKDFSHVDESNWQHANLEQGIDSTLNVVANEIKYKAEVVKEYGNLPEVECMPSQLNQVFMNMLINASQAIDQKGTITVRTGSSGEEVWVEVEDTGKGIAPENLNRIFDPFFTTKAIGKGTGLGLSLSYGIVQKHHGRIEVKSEVGKGTTFRVWLPVQQHEETV